jgi:hypothetical protein
MHGPYNIKFKKRSESILYWWNSQSVPKLWHLNYRRRWITQKKAYDVSESTFLPNESWLPKKKKKKICFLERSQASGASNNHGVWSIGTMILTRESRSSRRKTSPNATLFTTNLTWIDLGSKAVLRCERSETNRLSHGTAFQHKENPQLYLKTQSVPRSKHTSSRL